MDRMATTPSITVRDVVDDDLPIFFEHQQDEGACHMAAFVSEDPSDRAAFDAHWAKTRAKDSIVIRTVLVDGRVAGHVAKFVMDDLPEVTYWIDRAYWGRGVATAALKLLLAEIAERPIHAHVAKDNAASIRVLEKCGYRVIGEETGYAHARKAEIPEYVMRLDA
jgi:RimJ/RimL family protein N-acetyltransferase